MTKIQLSVKRQKTLTDVEAAQFLITFVSHVLRHCNQNQVKLKYGDKLDFCTANPCITGSDVIATVNNNEYAEDGKGWRITILLKGAITDHQVLSTALKNTSCIIITTETSGSHEQVNFHIVSPANKRVAEFRFYNSIDDLIPAELAACF